MALHDQWNIATEASFKRRVQIAMLSAAIAIQAEATGTPNHTNRAGAVGAKRLRDQVSCRSVRFRAIASPLHLFAQAVCAVEATLTSASPDAALNTAVASVWNALAGTV